MALDIISLSQLLICKMEIGDKSRSELLQGWKVAMHAEAPHVAAAARKFSCPAPDSGALCWRFPAPPRTQEGSAGERRPAFSLWIQTYSFQPDTLDLMLRVDRNSRPGPLKAAGSTQAQTLPHVLQSGPRSHPGHPILVPLVPISCPVSDWPHLVSASAWISSFTFSFYLRSCLTSTSASVLATSVVPRYSLLPPCGP